MDIKYYLKRQKTIIDSALDGYLPSSNACPKPLHRAMRYAVFPGGKRIRPVLTLAAFQMCGGRAKSIMPAACAIELIHSYTLIHDDLPCMDDDDYRRGKLTCHKKFNEGFALLAGDALLTLGFQLLSETGSADVVKEVSMAVGSRGTVGGQVADIIAEESGFKMDRKKLDYIASRKTGSLFEISLKTAGILKGLDRRKMRSLADFGRLIGFTFQLTDDLIDGDGYAKFYGSEYVKKKVDSMTAKAIKCLDVFSGKADRLSEIAKLISERGKA